MSQYTLNKDGRATDMFWDACLGGVEYWVRDSGHNGYMAVRIDPETLSFVRC
jgi:hypothetical protein